MTSAPNQAEVMPGPGDHSSGHSPPGAAVPAAMLGEALNCGSDAILILEPDGRLVWANESGYHALLADVPVTDAPVTWSDLWSENLRPQAKSALPAATRPTKFTGRRHFRGRQEQWWECRLSPLPANGAEAGRVLCIARDITGRRAEESAIRVAEARYRTLFENAVDGIFQVGATGEAILANAAVARILGMGSALMLVQDWPFFASESFADPARFTEFLGRIATQAEVRMFEYEVRRRDGTQIWVSVCAWAIRSDHGLFLGYGGSMKDISTRRQADQLIREQADFINRANDAITVTDLAGRIIFWNKGAERILGWKAEEALDLPYDHLIGTASGRLQEATQQVTATGEWRGELRLPNKAGQAIVLDTSFTLIRDESGRPVARLCIASDVTEKKRMEEWALHSQRLEGIGMLAAGIAHDLNNMLAPILLGAPMLADQIHDAAGRDILTMMKTSAERGAGLVRQILAFSRRTGSDRHRVQLRPLLHDLAVIIGETFPKTIRFEETIAPDLWSIEGNPTQIHQVLLNLSVNARDAMPDGGCLRLSAENHVLDETRAGLLSGGRPGEFVRLQVQDTGTGIPPEILLRIWEPFFTTKGVDQGSGLGLAMVRGIVEDHGGFITIDSTPGCGSTFGVWLPAPPHQSSDPSPALPARTVRGNGELILVVDDEPSIRDLARAVLTRNGYRVLTARDGVEAVAHFTAGQSAIALVLTDNHMPNLDGPTLAHSLGQLNPGIKIILMSGSNARQPAGGGQLAFLSKPFTIEGLLARVQEMLPPSSTA